MSNCNHHKKTNVCKHKQVEYCIDCMNVFCIGCGFTWERPSVKSTFDSTGWADKTGWMYLEAKEGYVPHGTLDTSTTGFQQVINNGKVIAR